MFLKLDQSFLSVKVPLTTRTEVFQIDSFNDNASLLFLDYVIGRRAIQFLSTSYPNARRDKTESSPRLGFTNDFQYRLHV